MCVCICLLICCLASHVVCCFFVCFFFSCVSACSTYSCSLDGPTDGWSTKQADHIQSIVHLVQRPNMASPICLINCLFICLLSCLVSDWKYISTINRWLKKRAKQINHCFTQLYKPYLSKWPWQLNAIYCIDMHDILWYHCCTVPYYIAIVLIS